MKLLTKSPKITVGANVVFCQQEVRFYQLAVKSTPISPKEQRLHPLVEVLINGREEDRLQRHFYKFQTDCPSLKLGPLHRCHSLV